MSAWVGPLAWTAAGPDRRPHLLQRLAIAAAISLGVHLLAMSGSGLGPASPDAPMAVHPLSVRTIVVPAAAPVLLQEPGAFRVPAPLPAEPPPAAYAPERQAAPERPARERRRREADGAGGGQATPTPSRATATEGATTRHVAPAKPVVSGYIPAGQLDPPPRPLHDIEPVYPPEAGFQPGTVVLRVLISATGGVDRVDIVRSAPPGLFESSARDAFAAARFSPGRMAGIAVKSEMTIEVEFTPINRGSEVSGRTY